MICSDATMVAKKMGGKMISYFRISKYNPETDNRMDWTDISDVGKRFNGKILTMATYKKMEKQYIDFVIEVAKLSKIEKFKILYLEFDYSTHWENGQELGIGQIENFIRECLECKCWGRLIDDQLIWEAGYDFYMHIGTTLLSMDQVKHIARKYHLFVENWEEIELSDEELNHLITRRN